jgi:hypothetical protein
MTGLKDEIISAHGGIERWLRHDTLGADLVQGGILWGVKGQAGVLDRTRVTVDLHAVKASHEPFGASGRKSLFQPDRVALASSAGIVEQELLMPRNSFVNHRLETPWSELQLAYFAGCAMWTYLNMPFLLTWPGMQTEEIGVWSESGESWRRLRVTFPPEIATHSTVQTLYVDANGLLKRHDYDVEIAGSTPGAHYVDGYVEVEGISIPTRRRIYPRQPDGNRMEEPLVVSIDLSSIAFG